jgi:hypothetical protein
MALIELSSLRERVTSPPPKVAPREVALVPHLPDFALVLLKSCEFHPHLSKSPPLLPAWLLTLSSLASPWVSVSLPHPLWLPELSVVRQKPDRFRGTRKSMAVGSGER